jgi:hypothetical protein
LVRGKIGTRSVADHITVLKDVLFMAIEAFIRDRSRQEV